LGGSAFTGTKDQFHYVVVNGQLGNVGRNTFIGPGQWFYNTSVRRSLKFGTLERFQPSEFAHGHLRQPEFVQFG
jgi:hypothetical protein